MPNSELATLAALLKLEHATELAEYQAKVIETPLSERKQNGTTWYPVVVTQQILGSGGRLILELQRTTPSDAPSLFQSGRVAALFCNREAGAVQSLSGTIRWVKHDTLQLLVDAEEPPDWMDDGKLGIDLLFDEHSFKEMDIALYKVSKAEHGRLAQLRDILLGDKPARFEEASKLAVQVSGLSDLPIRPSDGGKAQDATFSCGCPASLNESQTQALTLVRSARDLALIHGPPGTGKTTTLVEIIAQDVLTQSPKTPLLVCAPSNAAVDLLTEKLAARGLKVVRVGHPARIQPLLLEHSLDEKIQSHRNYAFVQQLRSQAHELRKQAQTFKRNFDAEARLQRQSLQAEARAMIKESVGHEQRMTQDVLDVADVITATLVGAAHPVLRDRSFASVYIDEAAQALEPACWIPICRCERVIMAGDHCQLPPTIISNEAARGGLQQTLFEKCIKRHPQASVLLQTQYRMNAVIMGFSNAQFYEGKLLAHESVKDHSLLAVIPAQAGIPRERNGIPAYAGMTGMAGMAGPAAPLEFIDTSGTDCEEVQQTGSSSLHNPLEADLLLKHFQQLLPQISNPHVTIGIITPYRDQVTYLRSKFTAYPNVTINSVDAFQGQERDLIYISLVRSNERGELGFLSDTRRMNVAMTRACKKLVILGNGGTLAQHPFYAALIDYAQSNDAYRSAWEFI